MIRALLLNDTSDQGHPGCELVVANLIRVAALHGIQVVARVSQNEDPFIQAPLLANNCDIVIVNGEGTMHDDRDYALRLMEAVRVLPKEMPKFLVNTVWQGNKKLNDYLGLFRAVFARESYSAQAVISAGYHCEIVPDLVFATAFSTQDLQLGNEVAVTDSVRTQLSTELLAYAARHRLGFIALQHRISGKLLKKSPLNTLITRWRGKLAVCDTAAKLINRYHTLGCLVSGRFHGLCIAIAMGKSVVAISSNTHKIEGLFVDAGLPKELIYKSVKELPSPETLLHSKENHREAALQYSASAKEKIDAMLKSIAQLSR